MLAGALVIAGLWAWAAAGKPEAPAASPAAVPVSSSLVPVSSEPELEPEPEPPADAFTAVEPLSDFSEGLAFARVTLPDGTQQCAYINLQGEIAITLPEGYDYGFAFHEGYAAVTNLQEQQEVHVKNYISDELLSNPRRRYNLIDTQGNLLYSDGPYCYIGPMGEGKVLTRLVKEDYNGTTQTLAFRDAQENIVWEADIELLYGDRLDTNPDYNTTNYLRAPWTSRYLNGLTVLYDRGTIYGEAFCYDAQGAVLQSLMDIFLVNQRIGYGNAFAGAYQRSTNTFTPLEGQLNRKLYYPLGYFLEGRNISRKDSYSHEPGFFIFDSTGNVLFDKTEPAVRRVAGGLDGRWIVELQNEYYALLDLDGNLTMEPVQERIEAMGDGLFLLKDSGSVIDGNGAHQFTLPSSYKSLEVPLQPEQFYPADGRFHEGIIVLGRHSSSRTAAFMDQRGNILQTSTDFRTSAEWAGGQTAQEPEEPALPTVPTESPMPLSGMEPLAAAQEYRVADGAGSLRLRQAPNTDAETVDLMWENGSPFYCLKQENGWAYGVYLGQAGWCSMEWLAESLYNMDEQLPPFLTPEQQCLYLQAATLYDGTRWGSDGRDFSTEISIDGFPYCKCKYFLGRYANYETAVRALFTGPNIETAFFSEHFKNRNGELYESCGDGGCILGVELQSYEFRLESRTDTQIDFTLVGHYNDGSRDGSPYTKEFPITMVKDEKGLWRFTKFASPYNGDLGFE